MNQRIYQKVKAYIGKHHMLAPGDTVVMGVSGGADSVCLFLLLCELAKEMELQLVVVHVHHGIRKEADEDAAYVEQLCGERKIPFVLVREDVKAYARREHLSEEEAGRKIRYKAFEEALVKYGQRDNGDGGGKGKIAVAHNANDRAETMLFHLFRGTGLAGAGGIRPVREQVIRPILCLKREEIEEYLKERQISFCIDCTNLEDTYTRNRIRNHILPYAEKEICKGAVAHMCDTADILLETEGYVRRQTLKAYERCLVGKEEGKLEFRVDVLLEEEAFIRKQVLLMGLEQVTKGRKDITSVHIADIDGLLEKNGSKRLSLPYGLVVLKECRKDYDRLILHRREADRNRKEETILPEMLVEPPAKIELPGIGKVKLTLWEREKLFGESEISDFFLGKSQIIPQKSCTKWFDYDRITKSLKFRIRETGDYLTINEKMSRKSLKEYMIAEKIPKDQRDKIYVLADGSHILWVTGYRISEYYKVTVQTEHILQVQIGGKT